MYGIQTEQKLLSKTNIFFSFRFEGTRGEKKQIFRITDGLIYEKIESEDEGTDRGRPENMVGRAVIEPVPLLNLPKPVRLVSLAVLQGIPTIATKESSTERYSENI